MTRRNKIALGILAFVTAPYWLVGAFIGFDCLLQKLNARHYAPISTFDSARWKRNEPKYRYKALNFVATKIVTNGMAETQVMQVLGKPGSTETIEPGPDGTRSCNIWVYSEIGPSFSLMGVSGASLLVRFNTNRVVAEVRTATWRD